MFGVNEDIVRQIVFLQERYTATKVRTEKELIIFLILHLPFRKHRKLHDMAHAYKLLVV